LVEKSRKLAGLLKHHIPEIEPLDILIEKPPLKAGKESYRLEELEIFNSKLNDYEAHPELTQMNEYLFFNRQAYIFCHPDLHDKVEKLFLVTYFSIC